MTEEEQQIKALKYKGYISYETYCQLCSCRISLADLAFRLRDEVKGSEGMNAWVKATKKVFEHINPKANSNYYLTASYFVDNAKPIHWIIAALIAKETQ